MILLLISILKIFVIFKVLVTNQMLATNKVGGIEGGNKLIKKFVELKKRKLSKLKG